MIHGSSLQSAISIVDMASVLFWIFACVLGYVYVGYPLLVRALAAVAERPIRRARIRPPVTVVISAYNEEKGIRAKIDNVLSLEYPKELLDIIVVSDASSDSTDRIVETCGLKQV